MFETFFIQSFFRFGITLEEMIYIGDEEKDIVGANALGIHSVLINRSSTNKIFQQKHTMADLSELVDIVTQYNGISFPTLKQTLSSHTKSAVIKFCARRLRVYCV